MQSCIGPPDMAAPARHTLLGPCRHVAHSNSILMQCIWCLLTLHVYWVGLLNPRFARPACVVMWCFLGPTQQAVSIDMPNPAGCMLCLLQFNGLNSISQSFWTGTPAQTLAGMSGLNPHACTTHTCPQMHKGDSQQPAEHCSADGMLHALCWHGWHQAGSSS